jgi:cytidyltransferase-like protein
MVNKAVVTGSFDNLKSSNVRLLEEASHQGELHVFLWSDDLAAQLDGNRPKFSLEERSYLLNGIRYVNQVHVVKKLDNPDHLPLIGCYDYGATTWVVTEAANNAEKRIYSSSRGMKYQVIRQSLLQQFPDVPPTMPESHSNAKKAIVSGCFDWFHSGHLRFFEEVSKLGDLYVVVGSDQNVRLLKGEGHPLFPQDERRYMVQSARFVKQALISTGNGWMDAEPEIERIKPDLYVVNEDGDKPEKRRFCEEHGLEYIVLKRTPKDGLPRRESSMLRGF